MAKRILTCYYCGDKFDANAEPFIQVTSRRYAHKRCAELVAQDLLVKEDLLNYINLLFGYEKTPQVIFVQLDKFIKENHYTYDGILKSLIYFFEIKKGDKEKAQGRIGIVPFVYNEAKKYYETLEANSKKNKEILESDTVTPIREVTIVAPVKRTKEKKFTFLDEGEI